MKSSNILQRQIIDICDSLLMARSLRSEEYSQHQYRQFKKVGLVVSGTNHKWIVYSRQTMDHISYLHVDV